MKKYYVIAMLAIVASSSSYATYNRDSDYCIIDYDYNNYSNGTCYWCSAGGTAPGNCKAGYAACQTKAQVVSVGSYAGSSGSQCTSKGFCYLSCRGGQWVAYSTGRECWQDVTGCMCDLYVLTDKYRCAAGYYGNGTTCTKCPPNSTSTAGSTTSTQCKCNMGYYKSGTSCLRCPSSGGIVGTTKTTGSTAITQCYIPAGSTDIDSTGVVSYTGDCYYVK